MLDWKPADVIYERVDCSIKILKWLLRHPDYKYHTLDNILDIIEGY
jgi:hypothetical protein